ncbi:hypothetical protein Tco_0111276 [Tanacetum coccineum]
MSSITAQQAKLDLELVPKEKRLEIGKCNGRLNPGKTQREPTFKLYWMLLLSLCSKWTERRNYPLIWKLLEISFRSAQEYMMHQHWRTFATIINKSLSGKTTGLGKLRLSRAQILWGMYYKKNVDYVELHWEDFTYQIDNRGHNKEEKMYYPRFTKELHLLRRQERLRSLLLLITTVPASHKEPTKKSTRVKRLAKKSTNAPTICVVIRDTLGVSASKKKAQAKADRGKDIELLSDAALLEDAQLKKALMKSRQETHNLQASGSSEGADFESEVPNESKAKSSDTRDSYDDNESHDNDDEGSENDDDSGNDAQDSKRTNSNEEANPNLNLNVDEEEETQEEEYVHTTNYSVPTNEETDDENKEFNDEEYDDLYKDVNVRSKVSEHEEVRKGDVEMHDATRESGSKQSSSVSSNFSSKILILDNVSPVIDEVASMMNVKSYTTEFKKKAQEEKDRYIDLVEKSIKDIIKDEVKSQLPQIIPKEVSDFATPVI